jgi:hypothetical protein
MAFHNLQSFMIDILDATIFYFYISVVLSGEEENKIKLVFKSYLKEK